MSKLMSCAAALMLIGGMATAQTVAPTKSGSNKSVVLSSQSLPAGAAGSLGAPGAAAAVGIFAVIFVTLASNASGSHGD
ncbi:MAG: hypothetical protein ACK4GO_00340 [Gemmobacter sp.]